MQSLAEIRVAKFGKTSRGTMDYFLQPHRRKIASARTPALPVNQHESIELSDGESCTYDTASENDNVGSDKDKDEDDDEEGVETRVSAQKASGTTLAATTTTAMTAEKQQSAAKQRGSAKQVRLKFRPEGKFNCLFLQKWGGHIG